MKFLKQLVLSITITTVAGPLLAKQVGCPILLNYGRPSTMSIRAENRKPLSMKALRRATVTEVS